ncbi:unnamed protein product, partial [Didymodactylos carnosus]
HGEDEHLNEEMEAQLPDDDYDETLDYELAETLLTLCGKDCTTCVRALVKAIVPGEELHLYNYEKFSEEIKKGLLSK